MQTECARCGRAIDTVQGYKFGPNQYLCMPCYDQFKAERVAKAKQQHKNPLVEQFGKESPKQTPEPPAARKAQPAAPLFQPKPPPKPVARPPSQETRAPAAPAAGPEKSAPAPAPPPAEEICDVCRRPLGGFKFPLKGGKKACLDCNNLLRDVARSLILNIQCPHCGREIQLSQE